MNGPRQNWFERAGDGAERGARVMKAQMTFLVGVKKRRVWRSRRHHLIIPGAALPLGMLILNSAVGG